MLHVSRLTLDLAEIILYLFFTFGLDYATIPMEIRPACAQGNFTSVVLLSHERPSLT